MSTARLLRNTVRDQKDWKTVAFKQFHFFDPTGYATSLKLTPSAGLAYGVATTPAVIRDGEIKSQLFNAAVQLPLEDEKHDRLRLVMSS